MRKALAILIILLMSLAIIAQNPAPGQITLKPVAASTGCIADTTGDVICAATDGFYISIAGGTFQKIATGTTTPSWTKITCSTATLSSGSTGNFNASGCTFQ